jgi:hypothetical protein
VEIHHYGRTIRVRGGELAHRYGDELWALVDRQDATLVTFMNLDYSNPFTMEICQKPSGDESVVGPDSGTLGRERAKIRQHVRAIDQDYKALVESFGNPRRDLLRAIRNQPMGAGDLTGSPGGTIRRVTVDSQMAESAAAMEAQREAIRAGQKAEATQRRRAGRLAQDTGIVLSQTAQQSLDAETQRHLRELSAWDELPDDPAPQSTSPGKDAQ